MKKFLSYVAALLFSASIAAQPPITITGADLPHAGQTFILANDTAPSILLGTPGSNQQTWNFTSLANHYYKAAVYDSTSSTSYVGQFSASNIYTFGPAEFFGVLFGGAPVYAGMDGYTFWQSDTTGLKVIGWNAIEGPFANMPVHENPTETLINTPATYGTTVNDTSRWTLFLGSVPANVDTTWVTYRTKTMTTDAWGILNTPLGNFTNVIRTHEQVTEIDSAIATLNSVMVYQTEIRRETSNNYLYMANGIGYPLAIVHADVNNNVKNIEYLIDTTCAVYSKLMGTIANDTGVINNGIVYLYKFIDSLTPMLLVDSTVINSTGAYVFLHVSAGNYLVSAQANVSVCPTCIPTYSGNVNFWLNGIPLNTYCIDTVLSNIFLTQLPSMVGNGVLSGLIQYGIGVGKTEDNPVKSVGVLLEQIPGGIKAYTISDGAGNYSFANVPAGTYKITVDVPGLPMVSTYTVAITSSSLSFLNLDFTVDTSHGTGGVHAGYPLAINETDNTGTQVSVYPNPSDSQFNVSVETRKPEQMEIKLYDMLGQLVYQEPVAQTNGKVTRTIGLKPLSQGIYTLQIRLGNEMISNKIVLRK
ncbi:MAG: T9SS type A sorting domain-containing protein [Chitinophagales bacterium]|jgi:hypothetical protein|nr:T9SS type A sorting domain-containing protein [Chitinophagales bacterium]